jgi:hypothetical protein
MRPNQQNKNRSRGRNGGRKNVNPLSRNFESNGPDVKIRGNAAHIAERYVQLARDAQASGDSVTAENYLQHAEHYFRILSAAQAQMQPRPEPVFDYDEDGDDGEETNAAASENDAPARAEAASGADDEQSETATAESGAASKEEDGRERTRVRRPRRRRQASDEERGDLSGAPQPEIDELPAFLTGGNASAAE